MSRSLKELSLSFDKDVELLTELANSGLYSIESSRGLEEFVGMAVISTSISESLSVYGAYNASDPNTLNAYLGASNPNKIYKIQINPKFYSYVSNEDKLKDHLLKALNWWEEHQFDTWGCDNNVYSEDPLFIVSAKKMWVESYGEYNPYEWNWV